MWICTIPPSVGKIKDILMKDCLQLEGDIHLLNERIEAMRHSLLNVASMQPSIIAECKKMIGIELKKEESSNALLLRVEKRLDVLEKYFDNDKFHNIFKQLQELEKEFYEKSVKIVKKMAIKK